MALVPSILNQSLFERLKLAFVSFIRMSCRTTFLQTLFVFSGADFAGAYNEFLLSN